MEENVNNVMRQDRHCSSQDTPAAMSSVQLAGVNEP